MKTCTQCQGRACEHGCGWRGEGQWACEMSNAGPNSHKICTRCGGTGSEPETQLCDQDECPVCGGKNGVFTE